MIYVQQIAKLLIVFRFSIVGTLIALSLATQANNWSNTMDYYESAEGITISAKRARIECEKHGIEYSELLMDLGERIEYNAQDVLNWLGY